MSNEANNHFDATFDLARKGGVKTSVTHLGASRIAFPDKRGPQPKVGETWSCFVIGENKDKTVWFVRCVKLVSAAPAAEGVAVAAEPTVKSVVRKPAIPPATAANAEQRAKELFAPVQESTASLTDIGAILGRKRALTDNTACAIAGGIGQVEAMIAATRKKEAHPVATLRQMLGNWEFNAGLLTAQKLIEARAQKEALAAGDRKYASMRAKVKRILAKGGELPSELQDEAMVAFKAVLDRSRQSLKALLTESDKISATSKKFNALEEKLIWYIEPLWHDYVIARGKIEAVVNAINSLVALHNERHSLLGDLASLVNQYEARVVELVS